MSNKSNEVIKLTDATFKQEVGSKVIAVVKFWQDQCQPCSQMEPIFKEVANEMMDVKFYEINKKDASEIGRELNINSSPTVIVFKHGQEVWRLSKSAPASFLIRKISEARLKEPEPAMTLERAYMIKGKCISEIEIAQAQLQQANKFIADSMNDAR